MSKFKYTQIPQDCINELPINAGIILTDFDPANPNVDRSKIIFATTGGISFTDAPTYEDFGADIDNCPKNMKEFKYITGREVTLSGTALTLTLNGVKRLAGAADTVSDYNIVSIRDYLEQSDFEHLWFVSDLGQDGGFVAIQLLNALSTGGFTVQTTDKAKGQMAFTLTGHYTLDNPDQVPYRCYLVESGEPTFTPASGSVVMLPCVVTIHYPSDAVSKTYLMGKSDRQDYTGPIVLTSETGTDITAVAAFTDKEEVTATAHYTTGA